MKDCFFFFRATLPGFLLRQKQTYRSSLDCRSRTDSLELKGKQHFFLPPGEGYFPKLSNTIPYKILEHKLSTGKHPVFLNGDTWFQHIYRKSSAPNLCTPSLERRGVVADLVAFG